MGSPLNVWQTTFYDSIALFHRRSSMKALTRSTTQKNRRGFVRQCFGAGASLATIPVWSSQAVGSAKAQTPNRLIMPQTTEYERILSQTNRMHVLGNPRSWSLVTQELHPFAPERVVVMGRHKYGDRCGRDLRRTIDEQIDVAHDDILGVDPTRWFPDNKRESIFWMMDAICGHYGVPYLEQWVVGLAVRKILGSTAGEGIGLAHQYQHGVGEVLLDNSPVDWWLFLYPEGYDWGALDEQPIFAIMCHVVQHDPSNRFWSDLYPIWALTGRIWRAIPDWSHVAQMGQVSACQHLNRITARCVAEQSG
jgi:hypothetical protein